MKAVICAFGTRGDVQPLIDLAPGVAETSWCDELVVVTHEEHQAFVTPLLVSTASSTRLFPVNSPAVLWKGEYLLRFYND